VIKARSWLYWNILSKKSGLVFSLSLGFSQDKYLCPLVLVYLLFIYLSILLLYVKIILKIYGKSNVNETNENITWYQSRFPSEQSNR
jgi:hypothetical protein